MLNNDWYSIQTGIEKPAEEPKSIDEMRKAILEASRHVTIVRSAMYSADAQGLSGEDRYAMLAYYALRQLEGAHQRLMAYVSITPMPPFIIRGDDQVDGSVK